MAKKAAAKAEALFVKSKVREYIKSKGCNTSGDLIDGDSLNNAIIGILDKAIARAKANGRKTVQEKDL
jgi:histone H3/H4